MKFAGKLVYNKLVDNLLVYLVSKFHSIWLSSLKVVVVTTTVRCLLSGFSRAARRLRLF